METVAYNNQTFLSSLVRNPAGLDFKEMIKTLLCTFKQKGPESCFYFKLTKKKIVLFAVETFQNLQSLHQISSLFWSG